jgi:hypothetical protein
MLARPHQVPPGLSTLCQGIVGKGFGAISEVLDGCGPKASCGTNKSGQTICWETFRAFRHVHCLSAGWLQQGANSWRSCSVSTRAQACRFGQHTRASSALMTDGHPPNQALMRSLDAVRKLHSQSGSGSSSVLTSAGASSVSSCSSWSSASLQDDRGLDRCVGQKHACRAAGLMC